MLRLLIALLSLSAYSQQNIQLIDWFAGADLVGAFADGDADLNSDFQVREFEFSAMSQIDQNFQGVLTLSYHRELQLEHNEIEIHEAFISNSGLIPLSQVRVGKFFLGFGRINQFHRHDWNFTDAPMVQKAFFGNEGVKDTGVEVTRNILSLGSTISLGVTSGNEFDHTNHNHDEEEEHASAKAPTTYLRASKFIELSTTQGFDTGLNAIFRNDEESIKRSYFGLDFVYKNRAGSFLETLVESEAWLQNAKTEDYGAYLYFQRAWDRHHAWGMRADYFKLGHEDEEHAHEHSIDGLVPDEEYHALSLSYIYSNSEFLKTRFTVEHVRGIEIDEKEDQVSRAFLQVVFNIGKHPDHVY